MADRPDYYALLGVTRADSELAIRAAYRRLVLKHHPDRNPGDPESSARLRHLVEAYEVLGEPTARARYDSGHRSPPAAEVTPFEELLGRVVDAFVSVRDERRMAGRDHQYRMTLSFAEAARGVSKVLELPHKVRCSSCEGRGFPLEVLPLVCEGCQGAGALESRKSLRRVIERCEACNGQGYIIEQSCTQCAGEGLQEVRRSVTIDVPAGVTSASRLVVKGAGQPGTGGGASGDCFVLVTIEPHPVLMRSGRDVVMSRPVTVLQALTGAWLTVPTVDGVRRLRLPANSANESILRMVGLGIGSPAGERGDQLVTIEIEYPADMSEELKEALTLLEQGSGEEVFPLTRRFEAVHGGSHGDVLCSDD